MTDMAIKKYNVNYLSFSGDTEISQIEDIGEAVTELNEPDSSAKPNSKTIEGEIDTVEKFEYLACTSCNSKWNTWVT